MDKKRLKIVGWVWVFLIVIGAICLHQQMLFNYYTEIWGMWKGMVFVIATFHGPVLSLYVYFIVPKND